MCAAVEGSRVTALVLAAGAGRRMGRPKATVIGRDGVPWLVRTVRALLDGGCDDVCVVLGAGHETASRLLSESGLDSGPDPGLDTGLDSGRVDVVIAERWAEGMGQSLYAGLQAAASGSPSAVLVQLVDLPDVGADVIARVLESDRKGLARAAYHGVPGHPVLIGAGHLEALAATLGGDSGARRYLAAHDVRLVECGDLARGNDVDHRFDT